MTCVVCTADLSEVAADSTKTERRQVFDIPEPKLEITERKRALKRLAICEAFCPLQESKVKRPLKL